MSGHDVESLYKRLANEYAEQYGASLKEELAHIEIARVTPGMDAKVKAGKERIRRARATRVLGAVAAALVVVVMVPAIYGQVREGRDAMSAAPAADMEEPATEAEEQAPAQASEPSDSAGGTAQGGLQFERIPLRAELPKNFSISKVEQDQGKTVYYLDNTERDDAVVALERDATLPDVSAWQEIVIGGQPTYGRYTPDYSVLVFEKEGVLYELTCGHDLNTLVRLGEAILE